MGLLREIFAGRQKLRPPLSDEELFEPDVEVSTSSGPKILWIELTSKCPFKCIFCTREVRWGVGRNLDFDIYESLIAQLDQPEFIGLNYSGESLHYPRLIEAIQLAASTGAYTELVTALSSATPSLVRQIVESDLDRLAVSIHTLDPVQYRNIYGFGSLEALQARINDVVRIRSALNKKTPKLDFCFVAMSQNIRQLLPVCRYALDNGVSEIFVHPIIGRHSVPYDFSRELSSNRLTPDFKIRLRHAVDEVRRKFSGLPITVLNPDVEMSGSLGHSPRYYAPPLPGGARIYSCDQSPFESVHVLASGDVVVCEVHDEVALGNIHSRSIREIWHSERYRQFRKEYVTGANSACRECVWKTAYRPASWQLSLGKGAEISPQLIRGWYLDEGRHPIWSRKQSVAQIKGAGNEQTLRVSGILPHDPGTHRNRLTISAWGTELGSIDNFTPAFLPFDRRFPLNTRESPGPVFLEFSTDRLFRPSAHSDSKDNRGLGFALEVLELQ